MDKRLARQLIHILAVGIDARIRSEPVPFDLQFGVFKNAEEYARAYRLLLDSEYIAHKHQFGATTLAGIDYMERLRDNLKHPASLWLKHNWFPFAVAVITAAVAISGVVIEVVIRD